VARVEVNKEKCKACGLCIDACPFHLLQFSQEINSFGDHYVEQIHAEKCTGCALCALMCPDLVISVYK
jgi:2-oxoglutarate ferredoxin oxidoreductase subunit delta